MPFLGQDWRSPGDQWVRTSEGWERLRLWRIKVFENLNENVVARYVRNICLYCYLLPYGVYIPVKLHLCYVKENGKLSAAYYER